MGNRSIRINEVGNTYGRLTVIESAGSDKNHRAQFLCKCTCGKTTVVRGVDLRTGNTKSCGCMVNDVISLPEGEAAFRKLFRDYKHGADRREYSFELSRNYFRKLTKRNCFYCGTKPSQVQEATNGKYIYNGVDRIDSMKGYSRDNVVTCCKDCNRMKGDMDADKFLALVKKIAAKHFGGGQE